MNLALCCHRAFARASFTATNALPCLLFRLHLPFSFLHLLAPASFQFCWAIKSSGTSSYSTVYSSFSILTTFYNTYLFMRLIREWLPYCTVSFIWAGDISVFTHESLSRGPIVNVEQVLNQCRRSKGAERWVPHRINIKQEDFYYPSHH